MVRDRRIVIGGREIGNQHPVYVIAEISANHGQSYDNAARLIDAAARAGADAVKLQTYTADTLTIASTRPEFRIKGGTLWDGKTLHDLYREAYTPWDWQPKLMRVAADAGIALFSTPFDASAVDFLEKMNVPAHKVASFEIVDHGLLTKVASTKKPVIMSTGMASLAEIDDAVRVLRNAGCEQLALLKCTSAYPAPPEESHLATIPHLADAFGVVVGLSDHTLGIGVPVAAVALGARIIEKHVTLSRNEPGPDSAFSLEPAELKAMVESVRFAQAAVGRVSFETGPAEAKSLGFRRSLFVVERVRKGEVFTAKNVRSIRPAHGLAPKHLDQVLGCVAADDIDAGEPLRWDLVGGRPR
jgi:N-acetylneuraminate synthase